ncbi:type-1 angiotensin II receptor-like [Bolinopsis microptera]|uniref:type-1 angiotensin II receptor-like n=1 Tax=Bolinopsis microptera TaxID=2820187 RepID=UPI0030797CAE
MSEPSIPVVWTQNDNTTTSFHTTYSTYTYSYTSEHAGSAGHPQHPIGEIGDTPGNRERLLWIIFHVIFVSFSLIGDSIILIGATRFKAIKLHRVIVVVIQHLAVSDLMQTVFKMIPTIVSLVAADGWVMGKFLCLVTQEVIFICTPATYMLTCILSTFKLLIVQFPLRTRTWSKKRSHVICIIFWLICAFILPNQLLFMMFVNMKSLYFHYDYYICMYILPHADRKRLPPGFIMFTKVLAYFIPVVVLFILVTTSILMLYKAKQSAVRHGRPVRWHGILTVTITTVIFLVSHLPDMVLILVHGSSVQPSSSVKRAVTFCLNINIVANVFVYYLTVRSFREFLSTKLRQLALKLGLSSPVTPRAVRQVMLQRCQETSVV